jgi:hypothetical protein
MLHRNEMGSVGLKKTGHQHTSTGAASMTCRIG